MFFFFSFGHWKRIYLYINNSKCAAVENGCSIPFLSQELMAETLSLAVTGLNNYWLFLNGCLVYEKRRYDGFDFVCLFFAVVFK